jgi:hypothetical protein
MGVQLVPPELQPSRVGSVGLLLSKFRMLNACASPASASESALTRASRRVAVRPLELVVSITTTRRPAEASMTINVSGSANPFSACAQTRRRALRPAANLDTRLLSAEPAQGSSPKRGTPSYAVSAF